jgi:hypothetical protein
MKDVTEAAKHVVELLVAGKYSELEALTHGIRVKADDMARVVSEYGHQLVPVPEHGFDLMDIVEVAGPKKQWSVFMPLWTKEEGRSDLSIVLTVLREGNDVRVELDDILVP